MASPWFHGISLPFRARKAAGGRRPRGLRGELAELVDGRFGAAAGEARGEEHVGDLAWKKNKPEDRERCGE